jgi:integrase
MLEMGMLSRSIHFTKDETMANPALETGPDSLAHWMDRYQELAVRGSRSEAVAKKVALHLRRFLAFFTERYGHDHISACVKRDVLAWRSSLEEQFAAATVNNHMASLSGFGSWVQSHNPGLFPNGDPTGGVGELPLPPLEPRALSDRQVASLKNLCDRLDPYYRLKGRRWAASDGPAPLHAHARPRRDRAIVFVLLSTGLRRQELVGLDLEQVEPDTPDKLRNARKARLTRVQGKGKTERTVFLSVDARQALADYLEEERSQDTGNETEALFLSAAGLPARSSDGRLSRRAINRILRQIGRWHDAELDDPERHISPLRPHDLRHTFAYRLAHATNADAYELERRLGHRSQRYIQRYTNPPEHVAAGYVEDF